MVDVFEKDVPPEVENLIAGFEALDGKMQLEVIKAILEKMENGEVELEGQAVYPVDIGIEDGYASCRAILRKLKE